jgi:uncharacterized membrane protein
MKKILKKITIWKEAGLISDEQFNSIRQFEEANAPKNLAAYTIISLGAIVICIGIISLIASNWEDLGDGVKLLLDFLILGGLAYSIFKIKDTNKNWIFETLLVSYFILILASIGLISQIYNTGGKFYQAAFFWCAITLPIVLFATSKITSHIWLIAGLFSVTSYLLESIKFFNDEEILLVWVYSVLPSFLLTISFPLQNSKMESLRVFGSTSLFWSIFGFLTGTVFFSFLGIIKNKNIFHIENEVQGLILISLFFGAVTIYLSYLKNKKLSLLLLIGYLLYTIQYCSHLFDFSSEAFDAILFVLIWFIAGFIFHLLDRKRLFEFTIVSIGIRFLIAYFQLFTSLVFTGFGLIFSGILIISICVFYIKKREKITQFIGELI